MNEQKGLLTRLGETFDQYRAERRGAVQEQMPSRHPGWLRRLLPTPGNVLFTLLVVAGLIWANSVGALPLRAPTAAGTSTGTIAYQGRLADADGTPITDTVNMEFRLYDVASGGIFLWEELWTGSNGVQVSDGLFNVMLGSLTPIPQSVVTGNDSLFLGITVGTDDEMTPRVQLGSVPFAVQALTVPDGSIATEKLADGAVEGTKLGTSFGATEGPLYNVVMRPGRVWALNVSNGGDASSTSLDLSGSVSPNATAVLLNMRFQDSGSPSTATYFQVCKRDTVECFDLYLQESGHPVERFVIVQLVNGQIDYAIGASGSNTAGYRLEVWGYIEPAAQ